MKGLMVTLLVVLGSGTALAQQFGGNNFSADSTSSSAYRNSTRRTNQTNLQPLNRKFDDTGMRVAQNSSSGSSSSSDQSGFRAQSSQIIGGSDYRPDSPPEKNAIASDRDQVRPRDLGHQDDLRHPNDHDHNILDRQTRSARDRQQPISNSNSAQSSSGLRAWALPVSPEWERTLKTEGFLYAEIEPKDRDSLGEIVMFQDNSQFSNRSGTGQNVTSDHWDVYKNTAIIDVDDFSLKEIQKRTLTLRNLGTENLTGVALRYVRDDGKKIDVRSIGNIPGNGRSTQASAGDFGRDQFASTRGTRPNERRFDQDSRGENPNNYDPSPRNNSNNGGWDVNDDHRVRQPNNQLVDDRRPQNFQRDDRSAPRRDSRDRFASDSRDFTPNDDRRLSDDYFDSLRRRDYRDRDDRDVDYVRDRINENRNEEYSTSDRRYRNDSRADDGRFSRSNRVTDSGRAPNFDATLAAERRELRERLLDAKKLGDKLADDAAWLKQQREAMDQSRLARLYDDELTPLTSPFGSQASYAESRLLGYRGERLADRSTDPFYTGRRSDALSLARNATTSVDRIAQLRRDHKEDLNTLINGFAGIVADKVDSMEDGIDAKLNSLLASNSNRNFNGNFNRSSTSGRVGSLVSQPVVPYTLGGDMAASRNPRLASNTTNVKNYDGLNGGATPLDINGYQPPAQRGSGYNGNTTTVASDGRMLRLMWLLLLISLGANVYLAILSRSFYTQYEELADELRETFSSSSSL